VQSFVIVQPAVHSSALLSRVLATVASKQRPHTEHGVVLSCLLNILALYNGAFLANAYTLRIVNVSLLMRT